MHRKYPVNYFVSNLGLANFVRYLKIKRQEMKTLCIFFRSKFNKTFFLEKNMLHILTQNLLWCLKFANLNFFLFDFLQPKKLHSEFEVHFMPSEKASMPRVRQIEYLSGYFKENWISNGYMNYNVMQQRKNSIDSSMFS